MVAAHERLQRAAAEMNTFHLSTNKIFNTSEIDMLSQQLSQIPGDLSGKSSHATSPVLHRAKRSRLGDLSPKRARVPLVTIINKDNGCPDSEGKQLEFPGSVTQDEEVVEESPIIKSLIGSEYEHLIPDDAFSQFEI
jgi:hypothetical protein